VRPHFSEICKVLDKLCDQYAPDNLIPARNENIDIHAGHADSIAVPNKAITALPNQTITAVPNQPINKVPNQAPSPVLNAGNSGSALKLKATMFIKTLETPRSVWAMCLHNNRGTPLIYFFSILHLDPCDSLDSPRY
jgi:hypothetical protein